MYPPPFGEAWYGERYRSAAMDPGWFARSLIANAEKEGEGSKKLWALAARTPDSRIAEAVRLHAIDESRHAMLYVTMCNLTFPDAMDNEVKTYAEEISPRYSVKDYPPAAPKATWESVTDELIQMNIGEIRTRIHQLLLRPVISVYCTDENRVRLQRLLDSLLHDETRHVQYTARLIEEKARDGHGTLVATTTKRRVREFNEITLEEVGTTQFAVD